MDYGWSPSSVQEIADRTGVSLECLEEECSQDILHGLSHLCEPWEEIGRCLGLSDTEMSSMRFKHGHDDEELRTGLLRRWKEVFGYNATYRKLMEALLLSGNARAAQEVCLLLNSISDRENVLAMEGVIQFGFHGVTGKNIELSSNGLEARRENVKDGADAVVVGAKPLIGSAKLEVEILSTSSAHQGSGSIQIGVMQCKSGRKLTKSDMPSHSELSNNYCVLWKTFIWNSLGQKLVTTKYNSLNLYNVKRGDRVGMGITHQGDLTFFLNGRSHGVGMWNLYKKGFDLYPVVDLANACAAVRITTAVMSAENLQEACMQVIASCVHSLKSVERLPLPEKLKHRVKQYAAPRLSTITPFILPIPEATSAKTRVKPLDPPKLRLRTKS